MRSIDRILLRILDRHQLISFTKQVLISKGVYELCKPIYFIHRTLHHSNEEIERKVKMLQNFGFRVCIISDGENPDIVSCFKKMISDHLHE